MTATVLAEVLGAGVGLGLWLILTGLRGHEPGPPGRWRAWLHTHRAHRADRTYRDGRLARRVAMATAVAVLTGAVTWWPVAALLAGLATAGLPRLLGRDRHAQAEIARIEAIAAWTEMLRDTLSAAAGLEQAILATAPTAPVPIHEPVAELAASLHRGDPLIPALHAFASELADPTADLVITALIMATRHEARQLADLLGTLAGTAREQASLRLRIGAQRARTRTSVRVITATTLGMAGGLALLNRAFLAPYNSPTGQLVLLAIGGLFALGLWWLARIARIPTVPRIITRHGTAGDPT